MGVLGLTPFLQKTCPGVVKQLPERLRALAGKRIVIDGTLITQRFHFAPMPQPSRHVLSWYRLATHLRQNGVEAMCVFDGQQRSLAKEREIERRRRDRTITFARGEFEHARLDRLHRLASSMRTLRSTDDDRSEKELTSLRRSIQDWKASSGMTAVEKAAVGVAAGLPASLAYAALQGVRKGLSSPPSGPSTSVISYDYSGELEVDPSGEGKHHPSPLDGDEMTPEGPVSLAEDVSQLYAEYCQSVPHLATLCQTPPHSSIVNPEDEVETEKEDYALSKNQTSLTAEEAQFWEKFVDDIESNNWADSVSTMAETLVAKSTILSESYRRRTYPPTSQTYKDSKEILRAMGIPCIEPSGPYEAEALAASLVLSGHADYVASEDTDVLIYDAPLVRNIASIQGPLVLISGSEVRTALDLDRARFIDFALLLGTDFSQRIKNVGPARALKFIREYGSIEEVLQQQTRYPPREPPAEYLEQVALARNVFQSLPPVPDIALLRQRDVNEGEVLDILDKHNLRRYALDEGDLDYSHTLSGNYFEDNPTAA